MLENIIICLVTGVISSSIVSLHFKKQIDQENILFDLKEMKQNCLLNLQILTFELGEYLFIDDLKIRERYFENIKRITNQMPNIHVPEHYKKIISEDFLNTLDNIRSSNANYKLKFSSGIDSQELHSELKQYYETAWHNYMLLAVLNIRK